MQENPLAKDLDEILSQTALFFEALRGQRLFITGGTGFFGCWLLESFLWANKKLNLQAEAVVLTRSASAFAKKYPYFADQSSLFFHEGDVRDFIYPSGHFSHVIHAATDVSNQQDSLSTLDIIIQGTVQSLEFARHCGAKQFLYVSSGAVYGKQPPMLSHIHEEYPCQPDTTHSQSSYAVGKCAAEDLCVLYAREFGMAIKIARCFAFVGPYMPLNSHHAIGNFIRDALAGDAIVIHGDGTPYRSYLYAADLTAWLWTILFRGDSLKPYNVGSDEAVTIAQLAKIVANVAASKPNVNILKTPTVDTLPERYVPDISRFKRELNLTPQKNLTQAIQAAINWFSRESGDIVCR